MFGAVGEVFVRYMIMRIPSIVHLIYGKQNPTEIGIRFEWLNGFNSRKYFEYYRFDTFIKST